MGMFDGITQIASGITGAIGDIIDPVSSLLTGGLNYIGTQQQNQAAAQRQADANAFNAQQFATRYQTTVKDLQAAGLNPMLAYSQGAGSGASSVAPAPVQNALGNAASSASNAMGRYTEYLQRQADLKVKDNTADNIAADTSLKRAQELVEIERAPLTREQKNQIKALTGLNLAQTDVAKSHAASNWALLPKSKAEGKYYDTFGWAPFAFRDLGQGASSAASVLGAIKGTKHLPLDRPSSSTSSTTIHPSGESTIHHSSTHYGN